MDTMPPSMMTDSILKQPTANSTQASDEQKAKAAKDRRNLGIALYHANKIQAQKDVSARILSIVEILTELPSGAKFTDEEGIRFANLIEIFQPSDFDDLVEERRSEGRCGYVLCLLAPRSASMGASVAWKLRSKAAGDYCSDVCLRKALYVRTQLNETPAWEREPHQQSRMVLDEEPYRSGRAGFSTRKTSGLDRLNKDDLALERGETAQAFRPTQVMADSIVEKRNLSFKPPDVAPNLPSAHGSIEGYVPRISTKKSKAARKYDESSADDDDDDKPGEGNGSTIEQHDSRFTADDADAEDSWQQLYQNLETPSTG